MEEPVRPHPPAETTEASSHQGWAAGHPPSGALSYSRERLAPKRNSMFRLLEAPGSHSDASPPNIYHLTCFLGTTFLLHAALEKEIGHGW